ncbi:MAG: RDD family protein [Candidatus Shapirobacteria bacterium]|nr:RDD family protein [Candidatus Shapirobacteria bacterium]
MKNTKAPLKALAFLIDNFLIYLVSGLISTFINPYASSSENQFNSMLIYIITLLVYITFVEFKFNTTLGKKILKVNN